MTTDALAALQSAVRLLQAGRAEEAERALAAILSADPDNADALAFLGLAHAHRGDNARAAELMAKAIALNPRHAATLFNYANVLRMLGRPDEAIAAYTRVLDLRPDHVEARRQRAHALAEEKRDAEALADLDRIATDKLDTLMLRAKLRFNAARPTEAIADYDRVVALDPKHWEAFNNRGIALDQLERYDEAMASYDRALALEPGDDNVRHNRGATLLCLQRYDEALPLFERLVAADPDRADNWSCHGVALASLMRFDEALASFEKAIARDPASLRAKNGKGMALVALGRVEEGIAEYRDVLALHPENAMTHGNLAFALLVAGRLREGFAEYEWRRKDGPVGRSQRAYPQGEWQGEDPAGKTLLVHPEQGFGDTVHFARFVPLLAAKGARVILEVPPSLETLMRTLDGASAIVRTGAAAPPFDLHAPLMSLAHKLAVTLETIPEAVPYLRADETKRAFWREKLAPLQGRRVGLCWAGHKIHRNDHARSIALEDFAALTGVDGVSFVSLQREQRKSDAAILETRANVADFMHHVSDFADTAALIAELDLVITVDTSVAHVAGALGKPVWILIASSPDWRWLLGSDKSPWYPSARLFRQEKLGDWPPVVARVREALRRETRLISS